MRVNATGARAPSKVGGNPMKRRHFLQRAGIGLATAVVAAPAIAQSAPTLRWRLATSFPKSLDTLYGACEMFSKTVAELSDQRFLIQVFGPGEIVQIGRASCRERVESAAV